MHGPTRVFIFALLIMVPAMLRLIDHPANVAAVGGVALFCGAWFRNRKLAILVPLAAMFASDLALGWLHRNFAMYTFYRAMPFVYLGYVVYAVLGRGLGRIGLNPQQPVRGMFAIPATAAAGSVAFWVISNAGVWLTGGYPMTTAGLADCYIQAIPFFRGTFLSDQVFTCVLFGIGWLTIPQPQAAAENA